MTHPPRRSNPTMLDSPLVAGILAVVVVSLAALVLVVPRIIGPGGSNPSGGPPGGSAAPTASSSPALPSFVRPTPSPLPSFTSYRVMPGDTLSSIARGFGTTGRSIAWWNRGTYPSLDPESEGYEPDRLDVGWLLAILPNTVVDDNNPPTPSPDPNATPTPSPSGPTATPAPTLPPTGATPTPATPTGPANAVVHGPRTAANIALTFDMGGRLDPAVDIVRWLIDHEVAATLFPTGRSGTQTPQGVAALQLAATRPDLFDLGSHSWDHPDFTTLTAAQMADQLVRTEAALLPICGTTKPWFRPPFGASSSAVRAGVGAAGWGTMVMWDIDTIDWRPEADGGPTAAGIVAKIRANAQGGSIVLMHLGGWNTLQALPGILDAVSDLGLDPVTLTEMFD